MATVSNSQRDIWEPRQGRQAVKIGATMLYAMGLGPEPAYDYYAFKCKSTLY